MMPKNTLNKDEFKVRVYKLKSSLYDGSHCHKDGQWHDGAHHMLNRMLDMLDEYRY